MEQYRAVVGAAPAGLHRHPDLLGGPVRAGVQRLVPERQAVQVRRGRTAAVQVVAGRVHPRDAARIPARGQAVQQGREGGLPVAADAEVRPQVGQGRPREDTVAGPAQHHRGPGAGPAGGHGLPGLGQQEARLLAVLVVDVADGDADGLGPAAATASCTAARRSGTSSRSRKATSCPARRAAAATRPRPRGTVTMLMRSVLAEMSRTRTVPPTPKDRPGRPRRCNLDIMRIPPFALERYFARHEFSARRLLGSSDPEAMTVAELLALEPGAAERLGELWLGYTESTGATRA